MSDDEVPPARLIIITVNRTSANPFDVDVWVDAGDLDAIAVRAYLEHALLMYDPDTADVLEGDDDE
jgi:hypothetical protein